jgi:hypothetical protein
VVFVRLVVVLATHEGFSVFPESWFEFSRPLPRTETSAVVADIMGCVGFHQGGYISETSYSEVQKLGLCSLERSSQATGRVDTFKALHSRYRVEEKKGIVET